MKILGLSFGYHDASAVLLVDGKPVAAIQEERFSRIKHDSSFPKYSIDFCLDFTSIFASELDAVVYYEQPLVKLDRVVAASLDGEIENRSYLDAVIKAWRHDQKFTPLNLIADYLKIPLSLIHTIEHHQAHSASAFFSSGFQQAAIVTIDGVGEYETLSVSRGNDHSITKLYSQSLPHSLGLFYSAFTAFLGFEVNEGEYKVMGMSGFGKPVLADIIRSYVHLKPDGLFEIDQTCFEFLSPTDFPFNSKLIDQFGPPRKPESKFAFDPNEKVEPGTTHYYANLAASIQLVTEEIITHVVDHAIKNTDLPDVCLAGGVALNSVANGKLSKHIPGRLYVQPAAGDAGNSLGAASYYYHCIANQPRTTPLTSPSLGKAYTTQDIKNALKRSGMSVVHVCESEQEIIQRTAKFLSEGKVIGWAQGRFEWGPRSLGFRSILADPTRPDMQYKVNSKIKFREAFRPFAPAVVAERAEEFFDIKRPENSWAPEFFMLSVADVRPSVRSKLPAITHVDGTARVQMVDKNVMPLFHELLTEFGKLTGIPVLLNTSFNLRGEPIVSSPDDAMKTFSWSNIDLLVFNDHIIGRDIVL